MELKIRLEEGTHRRLKVVCAERGVSMQEYVSAWVKSAVEQREVVGRVVIGEGKPELKGVSKEKAVSTFKRVSAAPLFECVRCRKMKPCGLVNEEPVCQECR